MSESAVLNLSLSRVEETRLVVAEIVRRMREYGGNPTMPEACPDLFGEAAAA